MFTAPEATAAGALGLWQVKATSLKDDKFVVNGATTVVQVLLRQQLALARVTQ